MKAFAILSFIGLAAAQVANPKWITPKQGRFVELTAYNLAGYTPQQLWGYRNVERTVKFDTGMNCMYEALKSNGNEQKYDSYCWNKVVHWDVSKYPQCTSGSESLSIPNIIQSFWSYYDKYTVYQGQVDDPYYQTGLKYHRYQHSSQNKWVWFRTTDRAIVYEQYYDGTVNSWIKFFEGGIVEDKYLFTSDFRIPRCSNPFVALPASKTPVASFFSAAPESLKSSANELYEYILKTYDTDKDTYLDQGEIEVLIKDLKNYDFGKESITVADVTKWIGQFDKNGDKKISLEELIKALA